MKPVNLRKTHGSEYLKKWGERYFLYSANRENEPQINPKLVSKLSHTASQRVDTNNNA